MIKIDQGALWYQMDEYSAASWICNINSDLFRELQDHFNQSSPVDINGFNVDSYRQGFKDGWNVGRIIDGS